MPLGTSSSQVVMVVMSSPMLSSAGTVSAFVPHLAGRTGAPAGSSPLSPPVGETAASERPPSVEGDLVPYRLPEGPLEWSSHDEGGDARFVLAACGSAGVGAP